MLSIFIHKLQCDIGSFATRTSTSRDALLSAWMVSYHYDALLPAILQTTKEDVFAESRDIKLPKHTQVATHVFVSI